MSEKRPYGLTEDDHLRLTQARNTLRLLDYLAAARNQEAIEPELLSSAFWLLAEQLDQVLSSSEQAPAGRARA